MLCNIEKLVVVIGDTQEYRFYTSITITITFRTKYWWYRLLDRTITFAESF